MADLNAHLCIKMLHYHGFITRTDVTSKFSGVNGKDIGRADIFAARNGRAVNIEVKNGKHGFNLEDWRSNQRQWAEYTMRPPFSIPYYVYLTLGIHPANYRNDVYLPKRTWLIPYDVMIEVNQKIMQFQKTLVYCIKKGMNKNIQKHKLDAISLLEPYELKWKKNGSLEKPSWTYYLESEDRRNVNYGGFWVIPENHEFTRRFLVI